LILIALAPLPLGSNRPLPAAILGASTGALLMIWAALQIARKVSYRPHRPLLTCALIAYLTVCFWIFLQSIPLPFGNLADPVWQATEEFLKTDIDTHISINPEATLSGLGHLLTYAGVFWLTFQLTRSHERAWAMTRALTFIGSTYALYGIVIFVMGNDWVVIYPKWAYPDSLTSTFVNRNSYATFAGLALLCATVLLLDHLSPFFALKHPMRAKLVLIIEEIVVRGWVKSFAVITIAIALLLSASRGGISSTAIGLPIILVAYFVQRKFGIKQILQMSLAVILLAITVYSASGNLLSKRLAPDQIDSNLEVRYNIYATTWQAILTSPWKGTGFGTFADAFPAYRIADDEGAVRWDKAHNTYLENALELGIPAAVLLNAAIFLLALQCLRGVSTRRRNKLLPALGVAASMLVGLHSLVDFSLQIPAVAIFYASIMGLAVGQSWREQTLTVRNPISS